MHLAFARARPHRRRASAAVLAFLALATTGCQQSDQPVVLGVAGPFRTAYGASMRMGVEMAAREINQDGGIDGRPLELRYVDDAANPDTALRVAETLLNDPRVVAVVGHVNSGTMVQAAGSYQKGLPAVATSATSPEISRLGEWIFRVAPSDSANSVALARLAHQMALPTGILYENEDYGRELAEGFRTALRDAGGRVVESDPYLPSTRDLSPYLERMKRRGVRLVFLAGLEEDAARIIRQSKAVGLQTRFLGGDGIEGLVKMGAEFDGTMAGLLFHPDVSTAATQFSERFRAAYQREPDSFAALGYDATRLLAEAARAAGPDRSAIRGWLERLGQAGGPAAFPGVTGNIRFDANGDPVDKEFAVGVMRGGRFILNDES